MNYTINPGVFELNPRLHFGILIGKGLNNSVSTSLDVDSMRNAENHVRQIIKEEELRSLPIIQEYRNTMEKAGINPNKYPASTEAMLKRVIKGNSLPTINALVDLCNVVSLENQISLGGHDLRDIHQDLSVCFSKGTERFLPFGAKEYETVEEGELVFTSGDIVQTRKWIWRQSELGKMTLDTKDVFFQLVGFEDNEGSSLIRALDSLEKLIKGRFGGTCQRYIVKQGNQNIEF
ncbi:B3/B4 domain-containing protein (DNA/RNA-binding domain of Phe-tRNA-synthetase) [Geosporobacter subterraneus DSM 17957]|uniref:B3/B4 domain-containing protein (DNA/RNA-binding domain of Phe-tRNA-synthetase) n=1 Tax=Geosporobacter subterraneus DSM 17957 TaxID=1121919 RepID=A0A1M6K4U4_9FIRM|nr:phenylalanine--tRNA ligase beta subunit-related protein [Geosporobacter subterraneus]SHJ53928.1 B3/B4 domain-containing protein (DNA/RNA-binding domain of Phe-tRNA-synthetase) [Geosporobacter subterraneus DSM 17957]